MTLKPPTRTLPKVVMKEWPVKDYGPGPFEEILNDQYWEEALSDFTRVVEETGVLDQGRSQKEKSRDE